MCLAVPGRVVDIQDGITRMGSVDFAGARLEVCLAYVPEARLGDYVLVHAGFALTLLDEEEAGQTLAALDQLGRLEEADSGS